MTTQAPLTPAAEVDPAFHAAFNADMDQQVGPVEPVVPLVAEAASITAAEASKQPNRLRRAAVAVAAVAALGAGLTVGTIAYANRYDEAPAEDPFGLKDRATEDARQKYQGEIDSGEAAGK